MAVKAVLFTDPECVERCERARQKLQKYLANGDIQEMLVTEGLKQFDLGDPVGVPFLGIVADSTGECLTQVYFPDEEEDGSGD